MEQSVLVQSLPDFHPITLNPAALQQHFGAIRPQLVLKARVESSTRCSNGCNIQFPANMTIPSSAFDNAAVKFAVEYPFFFDVGDGVVTGDTVTMVMTAVSANQTSLDITRIKITLASNHTI